MIPYGRQSVSLVDTLRVVKTLRSNFLTQGPTVPRFEAKVCEMFGVRHAVATSSATSSLLAAYWALGVSKGDLVWAPAITFVATTNAALFLGAEVDFLDINRSTFSIDVELLAEKLEEARRGGRLPKVVTVVHMAGLPSGVREIRLLGERYGFRVIEDASHAMGASYLGSPVGSCKFSDITVFSMHPVKMITTGEGGIATTNSDELASRIALFRSHGVTRRPELFEDSSQGSWHYEQQSLGLNLRITELGAALGISQIEKLEKFVSVRKTISSRYRELLMGFEFQSQPDESQSSHHLEILLVDASDRREIFEHLREEGIGVNVHYMPVYRHPFYKRLNSNWNDNSFPGAMAYFNRAISLPIYVGLKKRHQIKVVEILKSHRSGQTLF